MSVFASFFSHAHEQQADFRRRLIGRRFEDETVTKDIKSWPFKVVDQGGSPLVEVEYLGETKQFSPQEISAMVLVKVRSAHTFRMAGQRLTKSTDEGGR